MDELLKEIKSVSLKEKKTLEQMVLKLTEEVGETSQAMLSFMKAHGSEYKKLNAEDVKEECIDVILVALAIFYKLSDKDNELEEVVLKKLNKWKNVMT